MRVPSFRLAIAVGALVILVATLGASYARDTHARLTTRSPGDDKLLGPVDWIFLVDTSASMSGQGPGAENIFPTVRNVLANFINKTRDGDSLTIFTFAEASRLSSSYDNIRDDATRQLAVQNVARLLADGKRTHTGAALKDGLDQANLLSARQPPRPAAIILLTDGMEDVQGIANPTRIASAIALIPDRNIPHVYYVSLGTRVDPGIKGFVDAIKQKAMEDGRGQVISDPQARDLPGIIERIRIEMPRGQIVASPSPLDIGDVAAGAEKTAALSVKSPSAVRVTPRWGAPEPADVVLSPLNALELTANRPEDLPIAIKVSGNAEPGKRELAIQLDPPLGEHGLRPVEVRVYFNVPPRPLTLQPNMLEIGTVSPGSETGPFTVSISSPADGTVRIAQHDVPAGVDVTGLPETALPVSPHQRSQIQFSIRVAENASLKPEQFSLKVKPESSSPAMLLTPQDVQVKMTIAWPWWKPITDFLWRWFWLLLIGLLLACAGIYFLWHWFFKDQLPCETPLFRALVPKHMPRPAGGAYLEGRGSGPIYLTGDVALGSRGNVLKDVTATVVIRRRGDRHFLWVEQPPVSLCYQGNAQPTDLLENQERELEHGCSILFSGTDPAQPPQIFTYRNLEQVRMRR